MSRIHSVNTGPELWLRRALWSRGYRYRINDRRLPGKPDVVLPKYRTVIFVHGCFWHGHKGCDKFTVPQTNTDFWSAKIARNQERDQEVWRRLEADGWSVIVVWECQLKKSEITATADSVILEIQENGIKYQKLKTSRRLGRVDYKERQLERINLEKRLINQ